jgi:hypothetical protein
MKTPEEQIAELKQSLAQAKQKKTLRDEFAMTVLPGIAGYTAEDMARLAYLVADAMLKERSK